MTDLFRGYDLTTVAEHVAHKHYERITPEGDRMPWKEVTDYTKHSLKSALLPLITDVLDALESDQVKPTEAKPMGVYEWNSREGRPGGDAGYEDQEHQHDRTTCTTWVLHMNIHPVVVGAVLERMAVLPETTGEYTYGDSWEEWGEEPKSEVDNHLAIYFDATPRRAAEIGTHLANHATFAGMSALGGDNAEIPPFAISTSGDYAEQLEVPA